VKAGASLGGTLRYPQKKGGARFLVEKRIKKHYILGLVFLQRDKGTRFPHRAGEEQRRGSESWAGGRGRKNGGKWHKKETKKVSSEERGLLWGRRELSIRSAGVCYILYSR